MNLDETLSDLYALRTGLGLISQEYDECKQKIVGVMEENFAKMSVMHHNLTSTVNGGNELENSRERLESLLSAKQSALEAKLVTQKSYTEGLERNDKRRGMVHFYEKKRALSIAPFVAFIFCSILQIALTGMWLARVYSHSVYGILLGYWGIAAIGTMVWYIIKRVVLDYEDVNWYAIVYCVILALISILGFTRVLGGRFNWVFAPIGLITIIVTITFAVFAAFPIKEYSGDIKECIDAERFYADYKNKLTEIEREIADAKLEIKELQSEIKEAFEVELKDGDDKIKYAAEINRQMSEIRQEEKVRCAEIQKPYIEVANKIWQVLQSLYGKLLNSADWGNVDLVIYYIETGRAESIKEALQLVDRQRQNDVLVSAVSQASEQITLKLDESVGALQQQLDNSFAMLSMGLARSFAEIVTRMDKQTDAIVSSVSSQTEALRSAIEPQLGSLKQLDEKLAQLSSQSNLQTQLLEKNNDTSIKLIEQAKKLRSGTVYVQ